MGALLEAVLHPETPLLQKYVKKGIPVHKGPAWLQRALERTIVKGPHASAYPPEMKAFIRGELHHCVLDGFSILLTAVDVVRLFGDNLKLSRIAAVPKNTNGRRSF